MGIFKKKKIAYKKEIMNKKQLTNEEKVIEILNNDIKGSSKKDGILCVENIGLTIEASVPKVNEKSLEVIFILNNDKFDDEFVESVSVIGENINTMIEQAVKNFSFTTLNTVIKALNNEEGIDVEAPYYDENKKFKLYKGCRSVHGEKISDDSMNYWDILEEEIKNRLGNKKVYWIKVCAEKTDTSVNCECRINGLINISISKIINEVVRKWNIKEKIYSETQFFILIQDDSTCIPYRFTKAEVNEFVDKSLKLYEKCYLEDKYENLMDEIFNITKDINLTSEIFCFLPEIFCELVYNKVSFQDAFVIFQKDMEICMFKEQLTSHNWMYENVYKKLENNQFSQKQIRDIVSYSATLDAINAALKKGIKMDDLNMTALGLNVSDAYRPC